VYKEKGKLSHYHRSYPDLKKSIASRKSQVKKSAHVAVVPLVFTVHGRPSATTEKLLNALIDHNIALHGYNRAAYRQCVMQTIASIVHDHNGAIMFNGLQAALAADAARAAGGDADDAL